MESENLDSVIIFFVIFVIIFLFLISSPVSLKKECQQLGGEPEMCDMSTDAVKLYIHWLKKDKERQNLK